MSHWKALAKARDVASADLRDALVDAYDLLLDACGAAWCDDDPEALLSQVESLKEDLAAAIEEKNDAEVRAETAEARLETKLQADGGKVEIDALETQLYEIRYERDNALQRLATVEPLIESYSDLLAMARKFITKGDVAKVPTRHVRAVGKKRVKA